MLKLLNNDIRIMYWFWSQKKRKHPVLQCDGQSLLSSHGSTHVMTSCPTKLGKQRENNNDAQEVCRTFKHVKKTPLDRINDQT